MSSSDREPETPTHEISSPMRPMSNSTLDSAMDMASLGRDSHFSSAFQFGSRSVAPSTRAQSNISIKARRPSRIYHEVFSSSTRPEADSLMAEESVIYHRNRNASVDADTSIAPSFSTDQLSAHQNVSAFGDIGYQRSPNITGSSITNSRTNPRQSRFSYSHGSNSNTRDGSVAVPTSANGRGSFINFSRPIIRSGSESELMSSQASSGSVSAAAGLNLNGAIDPRTLTFTSIPIRPDRRPSMMSSINSHPSRQRRPTGGGFRLSKNFTIATDLSSELDPRDGTSYTATSATRSNFSNPFAGSAYTRASSHKYNASISSDYKLPSLAPMSPMSYNFHFHSRPTSSRSSSVSGANSIRSLASGLSQLSGVLANKELDNSGVAVKVRVPSSLKSFASAPSLASFAMQQPPPSAQEMKEFVDAANQLHEYQLALTQFDQDVKKGYVHKVYPARERVKADKRQGFGGRHPHRGNVGNYREGRQDSDNIARHLRPTQTRSQKQKEFKAPSQVDTESQVDSVSVSEQSYTDQSRPDSSTDDRSWTLRRRQSNGSDHSFQSTISEESVDSVASDVETYKYHLMLLHLYRRADRLGWFVNDGSVVHGVSVRVRPKVYETYPDTPELGSWEKAIAALNCEVALKITSETVRTVMLRVPHHWTDIAINKDTRIQVLDEISHLGGARRNQFAAFVRSERCLVIWSANVDKLVTNGEALEESLLQYVWSGRAKALSEGAKKGRKPKMHLKPARAGANQSRLTAIMGGGSETSSMVEGEYDGYETGDGSSSGYYDDKDNFSDEEDAYDKERVIYDMMTGEWRDPDYRPVMHYASFLAGMAIVLDMSLMSIGLSKLTRESVLDGTWTRWYLAGFLPIIFIVASFFCVCVISSLWKIIGPVNQCLQNSAYYSGIRPNKMADAELPSFTIQMPVYREELESVIIPSINSLNAAIETYERQGGTVNIFVNDDGLQLFTPEEQDVRRDFYDRHNIAWVARPPNGSNGFIRKGRFAKASNMNFALALSLRVEVIMDEIRPAGEAALNGRVWRDTDENMLYDVALERAVAETDGRAWVGGNIRVGEFILIVDSDTRVPEDCFLDAASEMRACPEVAVIQHESDVMQVAHHYFENGIAHFTRVINKAISFCVANGEIAPFVGHNAFLRWQAVQEASFIDEDGNEKIWSESHVSEDFDMALRLQLKGYKIRWATYSNGAFKEGVSLTCADELNRWQKYAFGCSELMFNPISHWITKGPFTGLFIRFMSSGLPIHAKFSTFSYITSYYAIGCGFPLSFVGWAIVGLVGDKLDDFYLSPWAVFLTCLIIFSCLTNVAAAVMSFRLNQKPFVDAFIENFKWVFFFLLFFSGMSYHVMTALLSHILGFNMRWSSTIKEVERSNFFKECPAIAKRFWTCYLTLFLMAAAMIVFSLPIMPTGYRVQDITCEIPLGFGIAAHFLYPIALNPFILRFSY